MKISKSRVKSIVQGAVLGAGLLMAAGAFADEHWHGRDADHRGGHESHDRDFGRDRDRRDWDHHDWDRHDGDRHNFDRHDRDYDRGGIRFVLPLPPPPRVFFPFPHPPHVSFSVVAPAPDYITYARVVDVDPIYTRSYGDWDDRPVQRCDGYRVTYAFRGQLYTTRMSYDPGDHVRIRVGDGIEVLQ